MTSRFRTVTAPRGTLVHFDYLNDGRTDDTARSTSCGRKVPATWRVEPVEDGLAAVRAVTCPVCLQWAGWHRAKDDADAQLDGTGETPAPQPVTVELPARFHADHVARDLPGGTVVRRTARTVVVQLNRQELQELLDDARHYAGDAMAEYARDGGLGIISSARATVRRLEELLPATPEPAVVPLCRSPLQQRPNTSSPLAELQQQSVRRREARRRHTQLVVPPPAGKSALC